MDLKQLKYFITIAEEGNISRAAEKLHMSQPPLSKQLKLLEQELGVILVERSTRKIEITDSGKKLKQRGDQILKLVERSIKEVKDIDNGIEGNLIIGTVSSVGASMLIEKIDLFHKQYPKINFEVLDEDTNRIIELLNSGVIEIGIIRTPFNKDDFEFMLLPEEPMVVLGNNISNKKESISLEELRNIPLIVQKRYEKKIIDLCKSVGFEPRIICNSNDVRTLLLLASTNIGAAIIPKDCLNLVNTSNLEYKLLKERDLDMGTAIIWAKDGYLSSIAKHFLEMF
ncbi:MAG: LysR family transcriptional regulator [Clostridiaceae bacterium]